MSKYMRVIYDTRSHAGRFEYKINAVNLTFLSLRCYDKVCEKNVKGKINKNNVNKAIETFTTFLKVKEEERNKNYNKIYQLLNKLINKDVI